MPDGGMGWMMGSLGSMMGWMMGIGLLGWVLVIALLVTILVVLIRLLARNGSKAGERSSDSNQTAGRSQSR